VDPFAWVRDELQRSLPSQVSVHDGDASSLPFPDNSAHAIICADSFQWFATAPALFEISRVLQRRGYLCMLFTSMDFSRGGTWDVANLDDDDDDDYHDDHRKKRGDNKDGVESTDESQTQRQQQQQQQQQQGAGMSHWAAQLEQEIRHPCYHDLDMEELDAGSGEWRRVWEHFLGCYYGTTNHKVFRYTRTMTPDELVGEVLNEGAVKAWLGRQTEEKRARVEARVWEIVRAGAVGAVEGGGGDDGAVCHVPMRCEALWCQLLDKDD
jgi:SAM-dependent methyltransferase